MAHKYKRPKSPFWWIKTRDSKADSPTHGKTIRFSTGLRHGHGEDTRKADQLRAEYTLAETQTHTDSHSHPWSAWVKPYLVVHAKCALTLERYDLAWRNVSMFLAERHLASPRQLTRQHCLDYLEWRSCPNPGKGKSAVCHNTALEEIHVTSMIMREAVRRGFAASNPAADLGVGRRPVRVKPEYTDAHLALIRAAVEAEPASPRREFLSNSFEIARYQGCRLHETHINPMTDVDIAPDGRSGLIRFVIKGGRDHTAPLHPALLPLFQRLRREGRSETYSPPRNPSGTWFDFFHRADLLAQLPPGACFHSLRVTAVTRLARSGVSETKAMKFIGHATSLVHRSYQRLRTDDLRDCLDALGDTHPTPGTPALPS